MCIFLSRILILYHLSSHKHGLLISTSSHNHCDILSTLAQIGAEIFKKALSYPAKLIAKNAGVNGSVVVEKVSAC